jgi:hypothetical protein
MRQPPSGRSKKHLIGYPVAVLVAFAAGAGAASTTPDTASTSTGSSGAKAATSSPAAPVEPVADPAEPAALTPGNYSARVKILSKECFGSAGCNVEARVLISADSTADGRPAELTVRVTGPEDGAAIQTIGVDEDGKYSAPELLVSTPRQATKLKAKITDVEEL